MRQEQPIPLTPAMEKAVNELKGMISERFPQASFVVEEGLTVCATWVNHLVASSGHVGVRLSPFAFLAFISDSNLFHIRTAGIRAVIVLQRVRGGASEVGRTTTASVVASIFYIIVADCLFSVVFYILL